jgi:hypothetical protein
MEGCKTFSWEQNAMQTNLLFTQKFAPAILAGVGPEYVVGRPDRCEVSWKAAPRSIETDLLG